MKKLIVLLVAFLMLVFCNATASQAITLGFAPLSQEVLVGDPANVDLVISGLGVGAAPSVGAYDFDILFDPTILSFSNILFGDGLDIWGFGVNLRDAIVTSPGVLDLYEISLDFESDLNDWQPQDFTLATLTFNTLAVGTTSLCIDASDPFFYLVDAGFPPSELTADLECGSIDVVPEPATLLLLGSGLAGLGFLRKKKKNQVS